MRARFGVARLPNETHLRAIVGVGFLAGIGFTMSLFIGSLSFATSEGASGVRIGVLGGSLVAALVGFAILRLSLKPATDEPAVPATG